jgi:hypothetical protein
VGAGDGDAVFHAHQLGQHLCPGDDRDHPLPGLENLRVVLLNGRGGDHHINMRQVLAGMADVDLAADGCQALRGIRLAQVGAGDLVAQVQQDLGNAAHADAADADEVDFLDFTVHDAPSGRRLRCRSLCSLGRG